MNFLTLDFLVKGLNDPYVIKQSPTFYEDIKLALASLDVKGHTSASYLYQELRHQRNTAYGYTTEHIKLIYKILEKHTRSDIFAAKQADYPMYSSAVPIALAAYKEVYGIKYSSWWLDYPAMNKRLLGRSLQDIHTVRDYLKDVSANPRKYYENYYEGPGMEIDCPDPFLDESQVHLRKIALSDNTIPSRDFGAIKYAYPEDHALGRHKLPKLYWCMLTQTWIFDPAVRHPDMITDLLDWDNHPEPLGKLTPNSLAPKSYISLDW